MITRSVRIPTFRLFSSLPKKVVKKRSVRHIGRENNFSQFDVGRLRIHVSFILYLIYNLSIYKHLIDLFTTLIEIICRMHRRELRL
jgi:hypothetical protein